MNKVITITLGGRAYQLEEGGYDALRGYLETAIARLENNPDRDEILLDIERAIADKFRALLSAHKNVVETVEVNAVIAEMGIVESEADAAAGGGAGARTSDAPTAGGAGQSGKEGVKSGQRQPKRLYRIREGAMCAGICKGIGAYFNLDPTLIRLAFAFSTILWGAGIMVYIVLMFVIPEAVTPEEKAAATGDPPLTAEEFIRRAKEGYYKAMKGFPNKRARRQWARQWIKMREHSCQWGYHWQNYWTAHAPVHPAMGFTLPVLSVFQGVATILWICAFVSLLATGTVLGMSLPNNVPVWAAALFLFVLYCVVVGPMKAARRACHWSLASAGTPGTRWAFPIVALVDTIVWIIVTVVLFCLAIANFPELRHALESCPSVAHQAILDIKSWWHK